MNHNQIGIFFQAKIVWEDPSSMLSSTGKSTISTSSCLDNDLDVETDKQGAQHISGNKQGHEASAIKEEIGIEMDWENEQEVEFDPTEPPQKKYHRGGAYCCVRGCHSRKGREKVSFFKVG
jgi:hypothetical protein